MTGAHWRGHKLYAAIKIRPQATIWRALNHEEATYIYGGDEFLGASRICRATGEVMDNKWFYYEHGVCWYVLDTDVIEVDVNSARVKREGEPSRRIKRTI